MRVRRGVRRIGGRFDRLCPEKESELDTLNTIAILIAILFVAFWLGAAFCFVAMEPIARRQLAASLERRYRARIRQLENQVAIQRIGGELREHARGAAAVSVMDAEVE